MIIKYVMLKFFIVNMKCVEVINNVFFFVEVYNRIEKIRCDVIFFIVVIEEWSE